MKKSQLRQIIREEIKRLKEEQDPLFDIAVQVYDLVDYKDLNNKVKIKSALKKLGKSTNPLMVGQIINLINKEIKK